MRYRRRYLDLDDKMCQHVSLEIVEQIYPQQIICEQLDLHDAWEERERALNMFVVIHLFLAAVPGRDWLSRASWNGWPAHCMCWACL